MLCLLLPLLGLLGEYAEDGDLEKLEFRAFLLGLGFRFVFTALLGALTLGSLGSEGRTFFEDLAAMDWNSMKYALLGGIVWNFGNIFLTAAIAVAGMSIGFPIGGGLAWIGGIIFNYLLITLAGEVYPGNQALLWIGVVVIIVAICICGKAYGKMSASQASTPKKVSYWLLWQDWPSCFSMDWL